MKSQLLLVLVLILLEESQQVLAQRYADKCRSNIACAANEYCDRGGDDGIISGDCGPSSCIAGPRRCVPRLNVSEQCRRMDDSCREGLYCASDVPGVSAVDGPVCVPKRKLGAKCDRNVRNPCEDGLACDVSTSKCTERVGFEGDPCILANDCQQHVGFYCKRVPTINTSQSICTRKKPFGSPCMSLNGDRFECDDGFCARNTYKSGSFRGLCIARRQLGQSCSTSDECHRFVDRDSRTSDAICNKLFRDRIGFDEGICVLEKEVISKPGVICDPRFDKCDRRRGLSCQKFRRKYVCKQRSTLDSPCTSGSKFSVCSVKQAGAPLECRRHFAYTKKFPFGVDLCSRKIEIVGRGSICNRAEYAVCESGTTCVAASGVENINDEDKTPPLAYCMKTVSSGSDCSRKFDTVCEKDLSCVMGKCTNSSTPPQVEAKFAGDFVGCENKPCAPGLECTRPFEFLKRCALKTALVGLGEACYNIANQKRKCSAGLACTRDLQADGIKRCQRKGRVGSLCEDDDGCQQKLKCSPVDETDFLRRRTCYDPANSNSLGEECSNERRKGWKSNTKCGVLQKAGIPKLLHCTKFKPEGALRRCQVRVALFQFCSKEGFVACGRGLSCKKSICVPRGKGA